MTNGLLNYTKHRNNDHSNCQRFIWYGKCGDGDAHFVPTRQYWSELMPPAHARGAGKLAALLVDAFTLGPYMHKMLWATILYVRTCGAESVFHSNAIRRPKHGNWTQQGYELGLDVTVLIQNEQRDHKVLTSGRVVREKWHPEGVLQASQHRDRTQLWVLDAMEVCFPAEHVAGWATRQRVKHAARHARRTLFVQKFELIKNKVLAKQLTPAQAGYEPPASIMEPWPQNRGKLLMLADTACAYAPLKPMEFRQMQPPWPFQPVPSCAPAAVDLRCLAGAAPADASAMPASGASAEASAWRSEQDERPARRRRLDHDAGSDEDPEEGAASLVMHV